MLRASMKGLLALVLVLACVAAEPFDVTVVDVDGKPIGGVVLQGVPGTHDYGLVTLGVDGRYSGWTSSGRIVVRRRGYKPVVARPVPGLRVVMEALAPDKKRECAPEPWSDTGKILQLKNGETESYPVRDVDYGGATYYFRSESGRHNLSHGWGVTWGYGFPFVEDVMHSTEYEERAYEFDRFQVTDARGKLADGTRWRVLGHFGETASYRTKDAEAVRRFDAILDGVCFGIRR